MKGKDDAKGLKPPLTIPLGMWRFIEEDTIRVLIEIPELTGVTGSGYLAKINFQAVGEEGDETIMFL